MRLPPFEKPYQFIHAYRSPFWCKACWWMLPIMMRRMFWIDRVEVRGAERLRKSIDEDCGILLASNHCRYSDPPTLGRMGFAVNSYFHYAASWHLFQKSRFERWKLNRFGAFSVFREGVDREALREAVDLVAKGRRPLILFPEGTFYRQNERLGHIQDGVAFISRQAAKSGRPVVVHPIAMKYFFLEDPTVELHRRVERFETLLELAPPGRMTLRQRIDRITTAFVVLKEFDCGIEPIGGTLGERMNGFSRALLSRLERKYFKEERPGSIMDRVRSLRPTAVRSMREHIGDPLKLADFRRDVYEIALAQQLFAHDPGYLDERPCLDRYAEAIQRLEEDALGFEKPVARTGAVISIGEPLAIADFPPARRASDPFLVELGRRMQGLLTELLAKGPPAEWNCPDTRVPVGEPETVFDGRLIYQRPPRLRFLRDTLARRARQLHY